MIKRYEIELVGTGREIFPRMTEDSLGEYVMYDDIKHLLEQSDNSDCAVPPTASPKSCANCFWKDKPPISACNGCYDESNWEERT